MNLLRYVNISLLATGHTQTPKFLHPILEEEVTQFQQFCGRGVEQLF